MVEKLKELSESSITVKSAFLISLLCAVIGVIFTIIIGHEGRLSTVEATVKDMRINAELTQKVVMCIREDQITFYRSQNPRWKSSYDFQSELFKK
jgi:hypothetical protein